MLFMKGGLGLFSVNLDDGLKSLNKFSQFCFDILHTTAKFRERICETLGH